MASTSYPFKPHLIGSKLLELYRRKGRYVLSMCRRSGDFGLSEAPSCIFVGPIETASKETLESLYLQARDAYYSGRPIIVDDMFDRVEVKLGSLVMHLLSVLIIPYFWLMVLTISAKQLKLRWHGSKSVVKYPRCSIRQQSTYADAEVTFFSVFFTGRLIEMNVRQEDLSQAFLLAGIWVVFLVLGGSVCLLPVIYAFSLANHDTLYGGITLSAQASAIEYLSVINGFLFMSLGSLVGYPIVSASAGVLLCLWRNELASLKGACPNCGEEVFAFVRSTQPNSSAHRADCHVCDSTLEFRTKVQQATSKLGRLWVYGRVYLVSRRRSS